MTGTYNYNNDNNNNNNISGGRTFSGWPNRRHCDGRPPRTHKSPAVQGVDDRRRATTTPLVRQPSLATSSCAAGEEREFQKSNCLRVSLPPPLTSHRCQSPATAAAAASQSHLPCNSSAALRVHSDRKFYLKSANNNNNNGINNIIIRRARSHTAYGFCGLCAPCLDR